VSDHACVSPFVHLSTRFYDASPQTLAEFTGQVSPSRSSGRLGSSPRKSAFEPLPQKLPDQLSISQCRDTYFDRPSPSARTSTRPFRRPLRRQPCSNDTANRRSSACRERVQQLQRRAARNRTNDRREPSPRRCLAKLGCSGPRFEEREFGVARSRLSRVSPASSG